jgi:hypothetical protein
MSTKTLRKRISLVAVTALTAGVLSVVAAPAANAAHLTVISTDAAVGVNTNASIGQAQNSMFTAVRLSTTGAPVLAIAPTLGGVTLAASLGLLSKDSSSQTAQTATMLTGGSLSLYFNLAASTSVSVVATGGTFLTSPAVTNGTATYGQDRRSTILTSTSAATTVGVAWTAPTTAGTYTISMYNAASGTPTLESPAKTLGAQMVVTVVAASAGGTVSATKSFCRAYAGTVATTATDNVDSAGAANINGGSMYINFQLNDAYNNDLSEGNIVATATNGALIAFAANNAAVSAGTTSTVVAYNSGAIGAIRVDQPTANAPLATTVTLSYNGATFCTKTVGIAGEVAKLTVTVTDTQDLSASTGKANFLDDGWAPSSPRAGHFTVYATDAAGNPVATSTIGTFSSVSSSLVGQTIVSALSVDSSATVASTTSPGRLSTGTYTCGSVAGELKTAKLQFTNNGSGTVITSSDIALRCADNPYTYTASFDKASYVQGEIATLTVKFLDSKGNPANSTSDTGTWTGVTPMLTAVSATGAAGGLTKDGVKTFTYTVGTSSGMTDGTYTSIIDYTGLTAAGAVKATPTYKVSSASTDTSFTSVLKSVVALIASINKQIQALQKLILKR